MAQEIIVGATGVMSVTGHAGQKFFSVLVNTGPGLAPVPCYGGNGWMQYVATIKDLSGTVTCYMTQGAAGTNPFADGDGTMTITFDTGCSISFHAVIGGRQIVGSYEGLNIVTFNFAKNDDVAPTIAWVTS